jgi:S1-C subfamily serine protease
MELPEGVVLNDLHSESPFARAGLQSGDVILSLAGQPTNTPEEVYFRMATLGIGTEAVVRYLRNGEVRYATVALVPAPDSPPRDTRTITGNVALRGLTVARINPAVADELDLPTSAEGVIVLGVQDLAAGTGLRPGDIILAINGQLITTTVDVETAAAERSRFWQVDVSREGQGVRLRFRF